ncbi:MAG TPA: indole-3-glycerol phosphate synthase TrpC [Caulobacteraceae bacterium]|nr:indole-3-glycerol phosphate synthase TrpC [Caulobacteraceae bacterium]
MSVLARIVDYKRREVRQAQARKSAVEWEELARRAPPARGFAAALEAAARPGRPALIAEIKRASPSRGLIREDLDPPTIAAAYAAGGAACLSVLTDGPSFQGDDADLAAARSAAPLPCLRKDFLIDPWQVTESRALGADAVLLILAIADDVLAAALLTEAARWGMDTLTEVHDAAEMERAIRLGARLVGVNNRDLGTFETDLSTFERLAPAAPQSAFLVAESGMFTADDVARVGRAGARAVLVGESLMRQKDVAAAARALMGAPTDAG